MSVSESMLTYRREAGEGVSPLGAGAGQFSKPNVYTLLSFKKQAGDFPSFPSLFLLLYNSLKCNNHHIIEGSLPFLCSRILTSKDMIANCKNG